MHNLLTFVIAALLLSSCGSSPKKQAEAGESAGASAGESAGASE